MAGDVRLTALAWLVVAVLVGLIVVPMPGEQPRDPTLADAPEPHNHVFVENGEYFSAFGHVANEGPISYHVPTDTWVEGAPGFPVLQQGHANGCGFALAMLP